MIVLVRTKSSGKIPRVISFVKESVQSSVRARKDEKGEGQVFIDRAATLSLLVLLHGWLRAS